MIVFTLAQNVMGVVMSAGGSFQWFRNNLGGEEVLAAKKHRCDPYELLTAEAAKAPPGSEGLYWLPYLTGERTPHKDPFAKGAFIERMLGMFHKKKDYVIGVPLASSELKGLDALYSIVQMPAGIPVACVSVGAWGVKNAAYLAAEILGLKYNSIREAYDKYRNDLARS